MLSDTSPDDQDRFQCPGEPGTIGRAVHLARLADGYPACRQCPYRDDVAGLSERAKRKLPSVRTPKRLLDLVCDEGITGSLHEDLDPVLAGRIGAAFGISLGDRRDATAVYPTVLVAGDGRPVTQRHFAKVVEKLRWAGCDVVDLGTVPCPALSWAMGELGAEGGLYLGNPLGSPHGLAICFYGRDGEPLTEDSALRAIVTQAGLEPNRPVRRSGTATRADALRDYESRLADSFHGLRPLRFLLHTTCHPVGTCLARLLKETACKMVLRPSETSLPDEPLSQSGGHFAASIDDDGRRCRLWDERGIPVPLERLFLLIAGRVLGPEPSDRTIVVDESLFAAWPPTIRQAGLVLRGSAPLASQLFGTMVSEKAALGADRHGRLWYREANGRVLADALGTLTLLLGILSDGDRPFSEVLDDDVPAY